MQNYNLKLKNFNKQKGFSLLIALLVMAVVLVISLAISSLIIAEIRLVGAYDDAIAAYYSADAGIENALLQLSNNRQANDENYCPNPKEDPCYEVKVNPSAKVLQGELKQDQSVEVMADENNPSTTIEILWKDTGNTENDTASLEWTIIPYKKVGGITICNDKIDKGFYNSTETVNPYDHSNNNCYINKTVINNPERGFDKKITIKNIGSGAGGCNLYKLRLKCLAKTNSGVYEQDKFKISYKINPLDGKLTTLGALIGSTGTSNNVKRKIEVDTGLTAQGAIGVFDYVLYSEGPLYKPSE